MQQRLVAILAADVVGYSRMMAENQMRALEALLTFRSELFGTLIARHRGTIIKSMGDGWLVEFTSTHDAVVCGIALQDQLVDHTLIKLRIGIHIGNVAHVDEDIFGDGVNIAARLEALANPGGLAISDAVWCTLDGTISPLFNDTGRQTLKNIAPPVRVWTRDTTSTGITPAVTYETHQKPAIAVLPFDNFTTGPDQAFLGEGLVDDIITALSRFSSLLVISRGSSFAYRDQSTDALDIARELNVSYLVKGSVRRTGERLRVTVQLIDGSNGASIRAERFDRKMIDLFDLQDELTLAIVATVAPEIDAREISRVRHVPTSNLTAWELYQRALGEFHSYDSSSVNKAKYLALQAIGADPDMASPYALLARIHGSDYLKTTGNDSDNNLAEALLWANKAIACDSRSDEAHCALGFALGIHMQSTQAIEALERGIVLNPNNGVTRMYLAMTLLLPDVKRANEALEHIQMALRISPSDPFAWGWIAAASIACVQLGDAQRAVEYFSRCRNHPHLDWRSLMIGAACDCLAGNDEGMAELVGRAASDLATEPLTLSGARHAVPQLFCLPGLESVYQRLVETGVVEN